MVNARLKYSYIEIFRGVAILLVVLRHLSMDLQSRHGYYYFFGVFKTEYGAIDLFFVISGFVLMLNYFQYRGQTNQIVNYLKKRFIRIFPVYWMCLSIVLFIYATMKPAIAQSYTYDLDFYIRNIFLIKGNWVIYPAWFLSTELFLYLIFTITFFIKQTRNLVLLLILYSLIILSIHMQIFTSKFPDYVYSIFSIPVFEFILGIFASLLYVRYRGKLKLQRLFYLGVILWLIGAYFVYNVEMQFMQFQMFRLIFYALPFSLMCIGAVGIDDKNIQSIKKIFFILGQSSYSIYLLHMIVLESLFIKTQRVMREYGNAFTFFLEATLIGFVSIILPILFHLIVEKRVIVYMKRILSVNS
jgi:exopolysaccharide production protein ExoZ